MRKYVHRVVRGAAREFAREFHREEQRLRSAEPEREQAQEPPALVRIDVADAVSQLGGNPSKHALNQFYSMNHRWIAWLTERNRRTAVSTHDLIDNHMDGALFVLDQMKVLRSRANEINQVEGHILDLGVYKGASTRALATIFADRHIHGFDSFEGMPEDWEHVLKGDFGDIAGRLPSVPENASLYKGWFDDTLPVWAAEREGDPIALLRVDCDVYSSTKIILDELGPMLRPGSWILFDELIGYHGWEAHEYKAFNEFIDASDFTFEYIAYGLTYVLVRLGGCSPHT